MSRLPVIGFPALRVLEAGGSVPAPSAEDAAVVERLRCGDESAFRALVERHQSAMLRVAEAYVSSRAAAEEVVQETWLGVLRGLDGFEGRSSLKTWIFRILVNRAKSWGVSERRCIAFSSFGEEASVDADRFVDDNEPGAGRWTIPPRPFGDLTAAGVLSAELRSRITEAIASLPPRQRQVLVLRDVQGWSPGEARAVLGVSETNQRVLLHRARSAVRARLERYLHEALAA